MSPGARTDAVAAAGSRTEELGRLLGGLQESQGVAAEELLRAVESAVSTAWSQLEVAAAPVEARLDPLSGRLLVELVRTVVATEAEGPAQVTLEQARQLDPGAEVGGLLHQPAELPRAVAARAAKLVRAALGQRAREARVERLSGTAEASLGQLADGIVERFRGDTVLLRVGELEAYLPAAERIPGEALVRNQHLAVLLLESRRRAGAEGLQVRASRAHPGLLRRLLEAEVPELAEGTVTIRALAREPGQRSKVAVESRRAGVDAKGACIGPRGVRIRAVLDRLGDAKVDILEWSQDPAELVARALAPAPVRSVSLEHRERRALVLVASRDLTLAIGREGQNARLAARLSGWRVDIRAAEGR